ncbi:hypothetical protein EUGRSUZ_K03213 [Eucalyptus grandis]|uniref:Uncharacterized protein n=2 Tax=Eucalyptus grandis TaxID=71139 RepID=A0ACC3IZ81_EUCGR|nr:hypothetical protein EUGRSUZ_K03213 [Eucalyptus grandis]
MTQIVRSTSLLCYQNKHLVLIISHVPTKCSQSKFKNMLLTTCSQQQNLCILNWKDTDVGQGQPPQRVFSTLPNKQTNKQTNTRSLQRNSTETFHPTTNRIHKTRTLKDFNHLRK